MSDDGFDRGVRHVLREIAGDEAPVSLRYRLADLVAQAPPPRVLWFTPPLRLSVVVVAAVAVLALAVLLLPNQPIGPSPSAGPSSPTPSAERSATLAPSTEPTPIPSQVPTAVPTPVWTGLEWSAGVVPFTPNTSWISEIQSWNGGYVAVGGTFPGGKGTVFRSTDGQHWTVTYQAELPENWSFQHLVPLGDGLLAVSDQRGVACEADEPCPPEGFDVAPRLWYSADGESWAQIDSASWREALADAIPFDVVGSEAGIVGVLYDGSVVHSADGLNWRRAELPAAAAALPSALTAFDSGFVVVGRDGSPDPRSEVVDSPLPAGMGRPAAWFSPNGVDWTQADVPGQVVPGGVLREVAAGADGLFAIGVGEGVETQAHAVTHGWASADGMTWTLVGRIGEDLPFLGGRLLGQGFVVGDGSNMVIFGQESATSPAIAAYASTDGIGWQRLSFSGAPTGFVTGTWGESGPQGARYLTAATVVSDGVIASVFSGESAFWFGAATTGL